MLRVDLIDDIPDDSEIDSGVISVRDIHVGADDFYPVDTSRITREPSPASHANEEDRPCP